MVIRNRYTGTAAVALLALAACSEGPTAPMDGGFSPQLLVAPTAVREEGTVCVASPVAGTYTFTASLTGGSAALVGDAADGTFTLSEESCTVVAVGNGPFSTVNIALTGAPADAVLGNVEQNTATAPSSQTAVLTTTDLGAVANSTGNVGLEWGVVLVYEFTQAPADGCTHTIGYWQNHASALAPYLPIWLGTPGGAESEEVTTTSQAVTIVSTMGANGINKLRAQLLAAKLSIADGADDSMIAATIAAADAFLANNGVAAWSSLSKSMKGTVLGWMETLDRFNNGHLGAPKCD